MSAILEEVFSEPIGFDVSLPADQVFGPEAAEEYGVEVVTRDINTPETVKHGALPFSRITFDWTASDFSSASVVVPKTMTSRFDVNGGSFGSGAGGDPASFLSDRPIIGSFPGSPWALAGVKVDDVAGHGMDCPESSPTSTVYADANGPDGMFTTPFSLDGGEVVGTMDLLDLEPDSSIFRLANGKHVAVTRGAPVMTFDGILVTFQGQPIRFGDET